MNHDLVYLTHILESIHDIQEFCRDGKEAFFADKRTQAAVIRKFEVIGEAAKRLSDDLRKSRPEIPWRDIAAFRDVLIHNYMGVDLQLVWKITQDKLPELLATVTGLLETLG